MSLVFQTSHVYDQILDDLGRVPVQHFYIELGWL
jgi:hypothetical protein